MRLVLLFLLAGCAASGGAATLETDGAWVRGFSVDSETAYHGAMAALVREGYTIETANPLAGSLTAKSPIDDGAAGLRYTIARVQVESFGERSKVRLTLTRTHEPSGAGRRPNNDRAVKDRGEYEALLEKIAKALRRA